MGYYCHGRMLDLQHIAGSPKQGNKQTFLSRVPVLPLQAQH